MLSVRLSCSLLVALVVAGCSQTPTSPSRVTPGATVGQTPQTSLPVPPRFSFDQPKALGATTFLAFGDSITWGAYSGFDPRFVFDSSGNGYPERLLLALNTYHAPQRFTVRNEGQPGEQVRYAAERLRLLLPTLNPRPHAMLLLEGINDLSNDADPASVVTWLRQTMDVALAANIPVVVATMYPTYEVMDTTKTPPVPRHNGSLYVEDYNRRIRLMVAGRTNVHLVDLEPLMDDRSFVGGDGIHTTDAGFQVMASAFLAGIERAFPVRSSFQ